MKIVLAILCCALSLYSFDQNRKFLIHLNVQDPFKYDETGTSGRLNVDELDEAAVCGMIIHGINETLQRTHKPKITQDSLLNKICFSGVETFAYSRFSKRKNWRKEQKNLDYALKITKSENKMFISYAFRVDLLDLSWKDKYYYDWRLKESDLDLYKGKKPKIHDPEDEDYKEPVPLRAKTYHQMLKETLQQMKYNGCMKNISSSYFTQLGLAVKIDERSLHRNKRPCMFVMIMLAGKQSYQMKKKDRLERYARQEELYE